MSLIKGLHHAALKCSCQAEFQEAIHFYKEVLGLPVKRSWGEGEEAGIMFDTGAGLIESLPRAARTTAKAPCATRSGHRRHGRLCQGHSRGRLQDHR